MTLAATPKPDPKRSPLPVETEKPTLGPLFALTKDDLRIVNEVIQARIQSKVALIPKVAGHLVGSGGKRMRPMLTLACGRLIGFGAPSLHHVAAALELLHSATLLHDDVVDRSALRRGRQTAHAVWGVRPAISVGDFLLAQTFELTIEANSMPALSVLSDATATMAAGEVDQLVAAGNIETTQSDYFSIINAKTADLFAVACRLPATLAERGEAAELALDRYGRNLGLAFQLVDDALDYVSTEDIMGKAAGDDFREGKVTLPVILAYRDGDVEARAFWKAVFERRRQADDAAFAQAAEHLQTVRAIERTIACAQTHINQAIDALGAFPDGTAKDALIETARFAGVRAY